MLTGGPHSRKFKLTQRTQLRQRAAKGLTQKLALFRACTSISRVKRHKFCLHLQDTNILSFIVFNITAG